MVPLVESMGLPILAHGLMERGLWRAERPHSFSGGSRERPRSVLNKVQYFGGNLLQNAPINDLDFRESIPPDLSIP